MSHYFFLFIAIYPQQLCLFFREQVTHRAFLKSFQWQNLLLVCFHFHVLPTFFKVYLKSSWQKTWRGDNLGISIAFILFYLKIWSRLNINISLRKDFACSLIRCEPYQTSITLNIIKFGSRDCIFQAAIGVLEGTVLFVLDRTLWVCLHQISLALA